MASTAVFRMKRFVVSPISRPTFVLLYRSTAESGAIVIGESLAYVRLSDRAQLAKRSYLAVERIFPIPKNVSGNLTAQGNGITQRSFADLLHESPIAVPLGIFCSLGNDFAGG